MRKLVRHYNCFQDSKEQTHSLNQEYWNQSASERRAGLLHSRGESTEPPRLHIFNISTPTSLRIG